MAVAAISLYFTNLLVIIIGIVMIVLASLVLTQNEQYSTLLASGVFSLPIVCLIAGIILLLVSSLGFVGAMKKQPVILKGYAIILCLVLLAEVTLATLVLVYSEKTTLIITDTMREIFKSSENDESLSDFIDELQQGLKCCGVEGYEDWVEMRSNHTVPESCCKQQPCAQIVMADDKYFSSGCYESLLEYMKQYSVALGAILITLGLLQLANITSACYIAHEGSQPV